MITSTETQPQVNEMTRKTKFSKIAEDLSQITPTETLETNKSNQPRKLKDIIADLEAE